MFRTNNFYIRAAGLFIILMLATLLGGYVCFERTLLADQLLPASSSVIPWTVLANSDAEQNGQSSIRLHDAEENLEYDYLLSDAIMYGYASVAMRFSGSAQQLGFVDLSEYSRVRFSVACSPANTLSFTVYTFDENFTDVSDPGTYRMPTAYFPCDEQVSVVEIDLQHMEIPEWWLNLHKMSLADRDYSLKHTSRFSFGVSLRSPKNVASSVKIGEAELIYRDWGAIFGFLFIIASLWLLYGYWLFKNHIRLMTRELQGKTQGDMELVDHQHVTIEPHRSKEKSAVMRFMAAEYSNPDLKLETVTSAIGVSKAKLNRVLKDETGLTFSAYVNKLRLAEAARLLAEQPQANVSEIAFAVGYNNVTYFNKLFKNEYGHSPKAYRSMNASEPKTAQAAAEDMPTAAKNSPSEDA